MGDLIRIAKIHELNEGTMKNFKLNGQSILLALTDGQYYATNNSCPHMGGDLSHGKLEGTIITCPRHSSQFDLSNGKVIRWLKGTGFIATIGKVLKSPKGITMYTIKIANGEIFIEK